jgi:hypothetical protein
LSFGKFWTDSIAVLCSIKIKKMEHLPILIPTLFILTTTLTWWLIYRASSKRKTLVWLTASWLLLQAGLSLFGFYQHTAGTPPRFMLLVFPPFVVVLIAVLRATENFDIKKLSLLHVIRVPVELVLYGLYRYYAVPRLMTFEGGNLDILSGLSAPLVYWFGFVKQRLSRNWLLAWNVACLLLLFNIVVRALLSAPFAFQRFGFEQPDIALLYFPYSLLPGFVVPAVLFAHLTSIRQLILNKNNHGKSSKHSRSVRSEYAGH